MIADVIQKAAFAIKRLADIIISGIGLVLFSPIMLVTALAVRLDSPGSILFRQRRIGLKGKEFWIYKFRSMVDDPERTASVTHVTDPLVTRVGRLLRLSSLDELPQLYSVLIGDMSLVGPRPLLPGTIFPSEIRRNNVRPGCTSLPVVSGRQSLDWEERMLLDLWYVDHWSLWLDLKILMKTVPVALSQKNVYNAQGHMLSRIGTSSYQNQQSGKQK
jgi:lipopolysaccharide/colanic/teichoic acid biosynthesis glycosyltransferase